MTPKFIPPRIESKPAMTFIGVAGSFVGGEAANASNFEVIPALWERYVAADKRPTGLLPECNFGLVFMLPEAEREQKQQLEYIAGTLVSPGEAVPEGMVEKAVEAQTYAVFEHHGPLRELVRTIHFMYGSWLPNSGYRHATSPEIEAYDGRFDPHSATSVMEYWLPIEKLEKPRPFPHI